MMELKELFCYRFQKWIEVSLKWLIHMYIKMVHHLKNLRETEEDPGPRTLQQVARWLGVAVVPAAPTPTGWQLYSGSRRLLCESMEILKWIRVLQVFSRWARINLRNMQRGTLRVTMEEIRQLWVGEGSSQMGPGQEEQGDTSQQENITQEIQEQGEQVV